MLLQPITVQFSKNTLKPSVYTLITAKCDNSLSEAKCLCYTFSHTEFSPNLVVLVGHAKKLLWRRHLFYFTCSVTKGVFKFNSLNLSKKLSKIYVSIYWLHKFENSV